MLLCNPPTFEMKWQPSVLPSQAPRLSIWHVVGSLDLFSRFVLGSSIRVLVFRRISLIWLD